MDLTSSLFLNLQATHAAIFLNSILLPTFGRSLLARLFHPGDSDMASEQLPAGFTFTLDIMEVFLSKIYHSIIYLLKHKV